MKTKGAVGRALFPCRCCRSVHQTEEHSEPRIIAKQIIALAQAGKREHSLCGYAWPSSARSMDVRASPPPTPVLLR